MIEISLCMIVKNEGEQLRRCLDSYKELVEEIIIVDTGSWDDTVQIAREYTQKVHRFEWIDDFAAARNDALSFATKDYVFVADGDEYIDELNAKKFLQLKKTLTPAVDIVQMKYGNLLEKGTTYNFDTEYRPKLFKRLRPFWFRDPIHETLNTDIITFDSDIAIVHQPHASHQKRDFGIFENTLSKGGQLSPKLHMMYARELIMAGDEQDFLAAFAYFEQTLHEDWRSMDEVTQAQCVVARVANIQDDVQLLFKTVSKNLIGSPCAEICCEIGDHHLRHGDPEEAATWFYTAGFGAPPELSARHAGDIALNKLADAFEALGEEKEAAQYREQAQSWQPPPGDQ